MGNQTRGAAEPLCPGVREGRWEGEQKDLRGGGWSWMTAVSEREWEERWASLELCGLEGRAGLGAR